jgi:hypothetical protein
MGGGWVETGCRMLLGARQLRQALYRPLGMPPWVQGSAAQDNIGHAKHHTMLTSLTSHCWHSRQARTATSSKTNPAPGCAQQPQHLAHATRPHL